MYFMEVLEHYFNILIQSAGSFYWVIGIILLFLKNPNIKDSSPYRRSKYLLATAFFVMGFNLFLWLGLFTGDWHQLNPYIACVDVMSFYLAALFLVYSFLNLLNRHCLRAKWIARDLASWVLTSALAWISLWDKMTAYRSVLFCLSLLLFFMVIVWYLVLFHRLYEKKRKAWDDYFSEDMQQFMVWLKKSLFFLVLSGVFAVMTLFLGIVFNYLYQFYVISVNVYIGVSFINYGYVYGCFDKAEMTNADREETVEAGQKTAVVDNLETQFGERIAQWVTDKKYLTTPLTIDDLAVEMGTNKLYMSRYINGKYHVNFSSWITDLRIAEAKEYMRLHPNVKQEEVAFHSGFSSSSYFSKVFSRMEGMTPAAWRREILSV